MPLPSFLRWLMPERPAPRIQEQTTTPTQEDHYWGNFAPPYGNDGPWRSLSETASRKDVEPATYQELHHACYEAYNANPIAFAIIEITTSFVLGKGVTISASNPDVQRTLLQFWHDADNHMDTRIYALCTELALYGEQFIRFYVNPVNGRVKIRQVDPSIIDQIETDPEDIETPLRFHRCYHDMPAMKPALDALSESAGLPGEWLQAGSEMMQFCINKVSNARRGRSDLATLLPWLSRYKDWLTDRVRINKYKTAFLWDVQLQGADRHTIERKQMEYAVPPEPGSIIIHNESERWSAIRPEIAASDAAADGRALKLMLAIGVQFPIWNSSASQR